MDKQVTVTIFESLHCSDCTTFNTMLEASLLPRYKGRVKFVHRDYPDAKKPWAKPAAQVGLRFDEIACGLRDGWRTFILARIKATTLETLPEHVTQYALEAGVDPALVLPALIDPKLAERVDTHIAQGQALGVVKTPTVFVNRQPFIETIPLAAIAESIDAALAREKPVAVVTGASR